MTTCCGSRMHLFAPWAPMSMCERQARQRPAGGRMSTRRLLPRTAAQVCVHQGVQVAVPGGTCARVTPRPTRLVCVRQDLHLTPRRGCFSYRCSGTAHVKRPEQTPQRCDRLRGDGGAGTAKVMHAVQGAGGAHRVALREGGPRAHTHDLHCFQSCACPSVCARHLEDVCTSMRPPTPRRRGAG